jgi:hypothetical protein
MMWEYRVEYLPMGLELEDETNWLNIFGAAGWQLICIHFESSYEAEEQYQYYFKRPIEINAKLRAVQTGEEEKDEGS